MAGCEQLVVVSYYGSMRETKLFNQAMVAIEQIGNWN